MEPNLILPSAVSKGSVTSTAALEGGTHVPTNLQGRPAFRRLWAKWEKETCLGPHIKYIVICNHTKNPIIF